jgi:putative transposase
VKWETVEMPDLSSSEGHDSVKIPDATKHFAHLFNAYAKYFNKKNNRHGSLFERPFERKLIDNEEYLRRVIIYIHNNPVHHGFCSHPIEYPWSSYLTCITLKPTKLHRDAVVGWFDNVANFKVMHEKGVEKMEVEMWLGV